MIIGQGLNYERSFDAAFNNTKQQLVAVDSNNYLLWNSITPTGQPYGFPSPQHRITKVNIEGDTLWERDILPNWRLEMIPSENGGVYISGSEIYGHMNSLAGWHIYRVELDGTINWIKSLDWYSYEPDSLITGLSLTENGKLMFNSSEDTLSVIFTLDTDSTQIDSLRVYEHNLWGIQNLSGLSR